MTISEATKSTFCNLYKSFDSAQHMRIMTGNRIVANIRLKLGQDPGEKTEDGMSEEAQKMLIDLVKEYNRLADGLVAKQTQTKLREIERKSEGMITNLFEYELIGYYKNLLQNEADLKKGITAMLEEFPIWTQYLKNVSGCGPLMAAVIITKMDPYKARNISSFWKYAGIDAAEDGKARSRRAEHLVEVEYTDSNGETQTRLSVTFNPFVQSKLLGVLGPSFIKQPNSPYRKIYLDYKRRLENHITYKDTSPLHRHRIAVRYMIKIFLKDLWIEWRQIEGLEIKPDYAEAKLGYKHGV